MVGPLLAAAPAAASAISAFIARSGITAAIKKYGRKAVMKLGKTKPKSTKGEIVEGPMQSTSTPRKVRGTKTQSGTEMPPTQLDVDAAKAAARKANEAAQFGRGTTKLKKGAGAGVGAAATGYTVGEAVGLGVSENDKRKNKAEVERLRRLGQKNAFKQAGEREAKRRAAAKTKADTDAKFDSARKTIKDAVVTKPKPKPKPKPKTKTNPTSARSIRASREAGSSTFTGRDGAQKANVTAEELKASGFTGRNALRDYLNKQQGKTRRKEMKKGGSVNKTTKVKKTNKVRGSGIAIRGVRPAKMR